MHAELKWIKHSPYKREIGGFKSPGVYHKDINSKETVSKTADESLRWFESMPPSPLYEGVAKWLKAAVRN